MSHKAVHQGKLKLGKEYTRILCTVFLQLSCNFKLLQNGNFILKSLLQNKLSNCPDHTTLRNYEFLKKEAAREKEIF